MEQGTRHKEQGTRNKVQGTSNKKQGTSNKSKEVVYKKRSSQPEIQLINKKRENAGDKTFLKYSRLVPCALHLVPFFYPKSILVLSPIFNLLVSPLRPVSLPMIEASKTISKRLEKEPMIEFLMIE